MSEAVPTNLPRFDTPSATSGLSALQSLRFDTSDAPAQPVSPDLDPKVPPACDASLVAEEGQATAQVVEIDAEPAALETILTALSETIDRVEREAEDQLVTAIQSIAAKLFPQLSQIFMAEEIGHHLPQMIPESTASVVIHTPPSLMEKLRQVVDRTSALSRRCTLVPAESSVEGRVDITWQAGGLNFDFSGLLAACLAQLGPTQAEYGSAEKW